MGSSLYLQPAQLLAEDCDVLVTQFSHLGVNLGLVAVSCPSLAQPEPQPDEDTPAGQRQQHELHHFTVLRAGPFGHPPD